MSSNSPRRALVTGAGGFIGHHLVASGQDRLISINELAHLVARIAGIEVRLRHTHGPMGVRGRNSDNTLLRRVLDREPAVSLEDGLFVTYAWIEEQVRQSLVSQPAPCLAGGSHS